MIDLGDWAAERFRVPTEQVPELQRGEARLAA